MGMGEEFYDGWDTPTEDDAFRMCGNCQMITHAEYSAYAASRDSLTPPGEFIEEEFLSGICPRCGKAAPLTPRGDTRMAEQIQVTIANVGKVFEIKGGPYKGQPKTSIKIDGHKDKFPQAKGEYLAVLGEYEWKALKGKTFQAEVLEAGEWPLLKLQGEIADQPPSQPEPQSQGARWSPTPGRARDWAGFYAVARAADLAAKAMWPEDTEAQQKFTTTAVMMYGKGELNPPQETKQQAEVPHDDDGIPTQPPSDSDYRPPEF